MPPASRAEAPTAGPASAEARRSAVEAMVQAVKAGIQEGRIVPGQRLVEPDLVEALGISRNSVREGLQRLAAEGVVDIERFRGARVRKLSRDDVLELNLVREVLEGVAAREAARRIDDRGRKALARLEDACDRSFAKAADDHARGQLYGKYNRQFHDLIIDLSGQRRLRAFVAQTQLSLIRLEFSFILALQAERERSRAQHRQIIEAIIAGNVASAERRMRAHVRSRAEKIMTAPESYFL